MKITTSQLAGYHVVNKFFIFATLFIIISGITGAWVVSTRLLYGFDFYLYGNLGKLVLFSAIVFGLLIRNDLKSLEHLAVIKSNYIYIVLSFALIPLFFLLGHELLSYSSFSANIFLSLTTHLVLLLSAIFLLPGIFGIRYISAFVKRFYKLIIICIGMSVVYDLAIFQIWKLWPIFSDGVLKAVNFLFSLTEKNTQIFLPRTIMVKNFAVSIEQACSGLDSLFLFTTLYILIAILEWKGFNKYKLFLMFIPAALGMYFVNILRVYILIATGAYVSPTLSVNLFHTYLGMVLFIIFFSLFWKFSYKWIRKAE